MPPTKKGGRWHRGAKNTVLKFWDELGTILVRLISLTVTAVISVRDRTGEEPKGERG